MRQERVFRCIKIFPLSVNCFFVPSVSLKATRSFSVSECLWLQSLGMLTNSNSPGVGSVFRHYRVLDEILNYLACIEFH
jgi:hypothetical protein